MITVFVANQQTALPIGRRRLGRAVRMVLKDAGILDAEISVAVVDDATIHRLNREFLKHDYPTDVLSFLLDQSGRNLSGEVIVSADTARSAAPAYGWTPADELLLYVIHGALHLVGQDDATPTQRAQMRRREALYLAPFGLEPRPRRAAARQTSRSATLRLNEGACKRRKSGKRGKTEKDQRGGRQKM